MIGFIIIFLIILSLFLDFLSLHEDVVGLFLAKFDIPFLWFGIGEGVVRDSDFCPVCREVALLPWYSRFG